MERLWSEGDGGQCLLTGSRFKVEMQVGGAGRMEGEAASTLHLPLLCSQCSTLRIPSSWLLLLLDYYE